MFLKKEIFFLHFEIFFSNDGIFSKNIFSAFFQKGVKTLNGEPSLFLTSSNSFKIFPLKISNFILEDVKFLIK